METYQTFTFDEVIADIRLSREGWNRVYSAPQEEYNAAVRREFSWPDGFLAQLEGKPLEAQMGYYRIVKESYHSKTAYGQVTKENQADFGYALDEYPGLTALIVENGVLIGVRIKCFGDSSGQGAPVFPYQTICTYYASDNNGSGSSDCVEYAHLCCVMPETVAE